MTVSVQTGRQVRIVATNGTDSNVAFVLNQDNDDDNQETYYQTHKPAMLEYSHNYYAQNRETILFKKKLENAKPENKDRRRQYLKGYYQTNKEQLKRQRREYSINKRKTKTEIGSNQPTL